MSFRPDFARTDERRACTSWEYDTSFWRKTIIMDFDLVCDVRLLFPLTPLALIIPEIRPQEAAAASDLSWFDVWSLPQWVNQ